MCDDLWHKVLFDLNLVHTKEPFQKLFNQGMILAFSYQDDQGKYYNPKDTEVRDGKAYVKGTDRLLTERVEKMSKSKLNVVNPDDVVEEYGADSLRLYEMFMGPLEAVKPWQTSGIKGVRGFLERAWGLIVDADTGEIRTQIQDVAKKDASADLMRRLNLTIHKVTNDIEGMRFNTAISSMMEFVNMARKESVLPKFAMEQFVRILSPFAPHIAEELWEKLGHHNGISYEPWPEYEEKWLAQNDLTLTVHFNGKKRFSIEMDASLTEDKIKETASQHPGVKEFLSGKTVKKTIYVPGKLINYIVEPS